MSKEAKKKEKVSETKETELEKEKVAEVVAPEENDKKITKKSKSKKKIYVIVGIILGIAILSIGGYFVYKNFIYNYETEIIENIDEYFDDGEYENIRELKDILRSYGNSKLEDIRKVALDRVNYHITEFNNAIYNEEELEEEYSDLREKLEELYEECTANIDGTTYLIKESKYEDLVEDLEAMYESKSFYIQGVMEYEDGEFDKALEYFDKVLENDGSFKEASKYIDKVLEDAVEVMKDEVEELLEDMEETDASKLSYYAIVLEYLEDDAIDIVSGIEKSSTYLELYAKYLKKYGETLESFVKTLEEDKDYASIISIYTYYLDKLEEDSEEYNTIKDKISSYEEKQQESENSSNNNSGSSNKPSSGSSNSNNNSSNSSSNNNSNNNSSTKPANPETISLVKLSVFKRERSDGSYYALGERANVIDWEGTRYNDGISLTNYYLYTYSHTYKLDSKYTKLTGKIIRLNETVVSLKVNIYADDKVIYTKTLTPEMDYYNLNVNLTGVQMLKIELVSLTDGKAGTAYALANPTLTLK